MAELQELLPFTKKLSLLYIDADKKMSGRICTPLKKIFALVDEASDGYEGLSLFKINLYDIVVMDANVPSMSGTLLIKNMRDVKPDQHIVYTSDQPLAAWELLDLVNHGIHGCLVKPFEVSDLLERIKFCVKITYKQHQQTDLLNKAKTLKSQHEQVIEDAKAREQKIKDELLYERKRLGRLLISEKELKKNLETYQGELERIRSVNELTGAASKNALQKELKKSGEKALLYLNIDNFDLINTVFGMAQGNKVLHETVNRLEQFLPTNALLFHVTADEFVVLINEPTASQAMMLADQIEALFREASIEIDDNRFTVVFSIGIETGEGMHLFAHAKAASKEAKMHGGGCIRRYKPDSDYMIMQKENLRWIRTIHQALEKDRLVAYYQPIVNNVDSSTQHYEVLCRIIDENKKIIPAADFIDVAVLAGLSTKISRIMIDKSFKHFSSNDYHFSININKSDLEEEYLAELLKYKCKVYGIAPSRVFVELREDVSMSYSKMVIAQVEQLREMGFNIAVDDFGTERSMLGRILQIQADFIKIDGSFICDISTNSFHRLVVENIVEFARKTGMKTVAEHVDCEVTYDIVKSLGVDFSQGYYVGKPALNPA